MNDFNPGPGWRQVPPESVEPGEESVLYRVLPSETSSIHEYRAWVREAPVPTESGYYVSGSIYTPGGVYRLIKDGDPDGGDCWDDTFGNPQQESDIIAAMPLSRLEPRAVTAKAIADRVNNDSWNAISEILRDFGATE